MSKNLLFFIIGNLSLIALVYRTRKRRRLNNVVLICTSFFFCLSIVETAYRNFFKPKEDHFANETNTLIFRRDNLLGLLPGDTGKFNSTRLRSSGDTIYHASYTIIADSSIYSFGFNHRVGYLAPDSPCPKIIFLGCSFTFGQGVNDSETLPYRLGVLENVSTLNLGNIGHGCHHVYEIFREQYANKDNKNRLFIYTMIPDHVLRAGGVYDWSIGPSFSVKGDSILYNGGLQSDLDGRFAYYGSFFGCYSFIKDMIANTQEKRRARNISPEEYQKTYLMIRQMNQNAKATGGRFLLLFWDNYNFTPHDPNSYYRQILEDEIGKLRKDSVNIIRVSDILDVNNPKYYFPYDYHPRGVTYDTIAKYLAKHLSR